MKMMEAMPQATPNIVSALRTLWPQTLRKVCWMISRSQRHVRSWQHQALALANPSSISVRWPLEMPVITATLRKPARAPDRGVARTASSRGRKPTPLRGSAGLLAVLEDDLGVGAHVHAQPAFGLAIETRTSNVVTLSCSRPMGAIRVTVPAKVPRERLDRGAHGQPDADPAHVAPRPPGL